MPKSLVMELVRGDPNDLYKLDDFVVVEKQPEDENQSDFDESCDHKYDEEGNQIIPDKEDDNELKQIHAQKKKRKFKSAILQSLSERGLLRKFGELVPDFMNRSTL